MDEESKDRVNALREALRLAEGVLSAQAGASDRGNRLCEHMMTVTITIMTVVPAVGVALISREGGFLFPKGSVALLASGLALTFASFLLYGNAHQGQQKADRWAHGWDLRQLTQFVQGRPPGSGEVSVLYRTLEETSKWYGENDLRSRRNATLRDWGLRTLFTAVLALSGSFIWALGLGGV